VKLVPAQAGIHGQFSTLTIRYTQYSILNTQYPIRYTQYEIRSKRVAKGAHFCQILLVFANFYPKSANFCEFYIIF